MSEATLIRNIFESLQDNKVRNMSQNAKFQFLKFDNVEKDEQKEAKLRAAASKIEQGIVKKEAFDELIDVNIESIQGDSGTSGVDTRPLYARLEEQKMKKKMQQEEAQKLSNYVSRLDDDDITFLENCDKKRHEENQQKLMEEMKIIEQQRRSKISELRSKDSIELERIETQKSQFSALNSTRTQMRSKLSSLIKVVKPTTQTQFQLEGDQNEKIISTTNSEKFPRLLDCYDDSDDEESYFEEKCNVPGNDAENGNDGIKAEPEDGQDHGNPQGGKSPSDSTPVSSNSFNEGKKSDGNLTSPLNENGGCQKRKKGNDSDSEDDHGDKDQFGQPICRCKFRKKETLKGVFKCIGILPSLPTIIQQCNDLSDSDDSSDSSDDDDDECGHKLICRVSKGKKRRAS